MLDTVSNFTARSISSALLTIVLKGSPSIFSRVSASSMYLEMEQLAVIHFLDTAKFNAIVSLIRTNQAYNVSLDPVTGRPVMTFQEVGRLHAIHHSDTASAELNK
jgi:hypothetical protein